MPLREDWTDNQELVAADHIEAHNALAAAANSGGTGKLCWFEAPASLAAAGSPGSVVPSWQAISDGVAPFVDAAVGSDPTLIEIQTSGTYLVSVDLVVSSDDADLVIADLTVALNDDSVGPLYDLRGRTSLPPGGGAASIHLGFPVELAVGDEVKFTVSVATGQTSTVSAGSGVLALIRVA